ncbi:sarcosine oxidase subunit gamma [Litoreibacter ponti]|uniref:Sarcosine oxidase subunit gamma n=1 Tax=Litoreibacter ponti TaxID=1510457 RepID=A0A2T6BHP4_9RHOB|nr:sarcosine oxidase subunit gamma family protein [Litoreibacter ponti]PTX55580.1 sarcosine oxidase subunit gamma [Litoreibacter ponti]
MSNVVSALQSKVNGDGFADIRELGLQGMITLRGDLASAAVKKALKAATGTDMPGQREIFIKGDKGAAWMSPDELLVMVPYADAQATTDQLADALKGQHALVVNVSDARAVMQISGAGAREVLAKLAPVDLSQDAFQPGMIRRTRLAQAAAAFWMDSDTSFKLVCFRSEAGYVFDLLAMSASAGSEVGFLCH